jgi:hypothetical protein
MKTLPVINPHADAIDVGSEQLHVSVAGDAPVVFGTFTKEVYRLREHLKADWSWDFIARTREELNQRLCTALKSFIDQPTKNRVHLLYPEMIPENSSQPGTCAATNYLERIS